VSQEEQVKEMVEKVVQHHGGLDVVRHDVFFLFPLVRS
jgi:D-alanine-D-alanine ligase-like ATP-grasp enzyme